MKMPSTGASLTAYRHRRDEQRKKTIPLLKGYCEELGIEYIPGTMDDDWDSIEEAAKAKRECTSCPYTVENCMECQLNCFYPGTITGGYMQYVPSCKKAEIHFKQEAAQRIISNSGMGKRFMLRRFETFAAGKDTERAYRACVGFCEKFTPSCRGIRLCGNYGCGKTHLAAAIIHRMAENGVVGIMVVVPELLNRIRKSFDNPNDDTEKIVKTVREAELLILDDLGAEKPSAWVCEQLYMLINYRYEMMLPTVITTNCKTDELRKNLGERTVSRIIEMTEPVFISAGDYRLKMAYEAYNGEEKQNSKV